MPAKQPWIFGGTRGEAPTILSVTSPSQVEYRTASSPTFVTLTVTMIGSPAKYRALSSRASTCTCENAGVASSTNITQRHFTPCSSVSDPCDHLTPLLRNQPTADAARC